MPKIVIDTEVYDALAARVTHVWRDTPNDVLRRLLDLPALPAPTNDSGDMPGQLGPLIRGGVLSAGQRVTWHRVKSGETHVATVTALGSLLLADGSTHLGPDRAATRLCGYPAKGWPNFKTDDGTTLAELSATLTHNT